MSESAAPPQVQYAPKPPKIHLWQRRLRWPIVFAVLCVSAYWWAPALKRSIELRYWFERCARHKPPPNLVVWQIYDGPPGYVRGETPYLPREWIEFYNRYSPPGMRSLGNVFLGEVRTPNGHRVLVAVDSLPDQHTWLHQADTNPTFLIRAFDLNALTGRPRQILDTKKTVQMDKRGATQLFAGYRHPEDPTRFLIPFGSFGTLRGHLNGWVKEKDVDIDVELGPTPPPPP